MSLADMITINIQPIFNTSTMDIQYAEVLLRSIDNKSTVQEVLNAIEYHKRSVELDIFMIKKSCEFIKQHNTKCKITVNISRYTLERENVYLDLISPIRAMGIENQYIVFEIHEGTNYEHKNVIANLHGIVKSGVHIAMDDFGTGNATLNNLIRTKVNIVKFDRVFLDTTVDKQRELVRLINAIHSVGMDTVIEGVETPQQLASVKKLGYKHIQGFILGRPVNADTYRTLYIE